jgi:CRP-like cAMP-binding protein
MHIAQPKPLMTLPATRPVSVRRLSTLCNLSGDEELLVKRLKPRTLPVGSTLTDPIETNSEAWIVLSGWCARVRSMGNGRKQMTHLLLPGDAVNVMPGQWEGDRLPVVALTPIIAADATSLRAALGRPEPIHSGLCQGFTRAGICEQTYCLNTIVRLGQQTAYERLAHLLLEVCYRLEGVSLSSAGRFHVPVTQDVIAHALGLSLVHLSRTLKQMRSEGSIAMRDGHIELLKRDLLAAAAAFEAPVSWSN